MKVGVVAIVGAPNVGKSTLLNRLVGQRLAIVSPKPQTTRHRVLGVMTGEGFQALLLDTPGVMRRARDELDRRMLKTVRGVIQEADVVLMVVEPQPPGELERRIAAHIRDAGKPAILAVNKVDAAKPGEAAAAKLACAPLFDFAAAVEVSALQGGGVPALVEAMVAKLPEGSEPLYPPDQLTDRPERFLAAELVREQLYLQYGQEIPYMTAVEIDEFREARPSEGRDKDLIRAVIYVAKESQKGILIGKGGAALKKVGAAARAEIEQALGRPIFLELWVKVRRDWRKSADFLNQLGV